MEPKYALKNNAVANLANSAGCNLKGPKSIQAFAPFTSRAIKITTKSNRLTKAYINGDIALKNLPSKAMIPKAIINDAPIQRACLPLRCPRSKKSE